MGKLTGDTNADMILSSADILRILGSNELIRLSASVDIVDSKPLLSGKEGVYIHINRFPSLQEFEATWDIWIEADEELDLVLAEMRRILPRMEVVPGLLTLVTTTEFRSESTQRAPEGSNSVQAQIELSSFEDRFQSLVEDVQDRMLLISSGRAGKNGQDGRDGVDGRDGKDLVATDAELFDLKDVDQSILPMEKGQVLTWDGAKWTNLFIPQLLSSGGGGGGGTGSGIEEAPLDGNYYVRSSGKWLNLVHVLDGLGYSRSNVLDGGDFTNGTTDATDDAVLDGSDFTNGITGATDDAVLDGGNFS
jgi:hypothetical protein